MPPRAVYLYATCLVDLYYPDAGISALGLLQRAGIDVHFPADQSCCGQPAWNSGYRDQARQVAQTQLPLFPEPWPIIIPSGSCAGMMQHHYPTLFANTPDAALAADVAGRVWELSRFLVEVVGLQLTDFGPPIKVTLHHSCSARRESGSVAATEQLLQQLQQVTLLEPEQAAECCGFGGTFAVKQPAISAAMVGDKCAALEATGAELMVTQDGGCLLNIEGALGYQRSSLACCHLATFLWQRSGGNIEQ